jgi:hypothetical protein
MRNIVLLFLGFITLSATSTSNATSQPAMMEDFANSPPEGGSEVTRKSAAGPLQKIELRGGKVRFGFVLTTTPDEVEVLDIQSNAEVRLKRTECG